MTNDKFSNIKSSAIQAGIWMALSIILTMVMMYIIRYCDTRVYEPIGLITQNKALFLREVGMLALLPLGLNLIASIVVVPILLIFAFFLRKRVRTAKVLIIIALTMAVSAFTMMIGINDQNRDFRKTFSGLANRSEKLITAIEQYKTKNGTYPDKLEKLVPEFIEEIPNTGLAGYPKYEYSLASEKSTYKSYELMIETSTGVLNWDVFVYWPEGGYPAHFYGGSPELIGKWAYVHE